MPPSPPGMIAVPNHPNPISQSQDDNAALHEANGEDLSSLRNAHGVLQDGYQDMDMGATLNDTNESSVNDKVIWNDAKGCGCISFGNHGFMGSCNPNWICPGRSWRVLQGILQYAGAIDREKGIIMTFGHGCKTKFIKENCDSWYLTDGPCGGFDKVAAGGMQKILGNVEKGARRVWQGLDHSADTNGAEQEDVEPLFLPFFKMFEIQANAADISAESARKREGNNQAARGLIGASSGFGASGENPVELRHETFRNHVALRLRGMRRERGSYSRVHSHRSSNRRTG